MEIDSEAADKMHAREENDWPAVIKFKNANKSENGRPMIKSKNIAYFRGAK